MNLKSKSQTTSFGLPAMLCSLMVFNCGSGDTRNLPDKIKVNAVTSGGYHVHARLLYYPTNPIKFICTGIFGEGLKVKDGVFNDISESGVEFQIKKKWAGICMYQFSALAIECSKSDSYSFSSNEGPEHILIGTLDSSIEESTYQRNNYFSANRISDNSLHIEVSGKRSMFWGCKDDCENRPDFGLNSSNQSLTISCQEAK